MNLPSKSEKLLMELVSLQHFSNKTILSSEGEKYGSTDEKGYGSAADLSGVVRRVLTSHLASARADPSGGNLSKKRYGTIKVLRRGGLRTEHTFSHRVLTDK